MMNTAAGRPPSRQRPRSAGKRGAVEAVATLVENNRHRLVGNDIRERDRFLEPALADFLRAALADFDDLDLAEADAAADLLGALAVALRKLPFRAVLQPADRGDHQPHGLFALSSSAGCASALAHIFSRL